MISFLFDLPGYQESRDLHLTAGALWHQEIKDEISYAKLHTLVQQIIVQLVRQGIKRGDRIILLSSRYSIQWMALDMGIMGAGAISVPLHYPIKSHELKNILQVIEPKLIIQTFPETPDAILNEFQRTALDDFISSLPPLTEEDMKSILHLRAETHEDDVATIVHTSGSSGEPKAVCLTHRNVVSNMLSVLSFLPFIQGTRVMSFLPLSHIFERVSCYVYLASGSSIYFLDSYRNALFAMKDVRPSYMTSVPMILQGFVSVMEDRIEEMSWFTRWAYQSWEKKNRGILSHIGSFIAHQWIIKRWKRTMGGRLKGIICGAAYLDPKVEKLYERGGIKIRQGYGLTETSPIVSMNRFEPGGHMRGTVGLPIPGVKVKIAEDGEILVQGPNVMNGYYKDDASTQAVIRDGWFHTGDVGHWEKEDFLVITDRKSNVFKHASGKFIAPALIESILDHHPLIQQSMIIGFQRPYTIALILPQFDHLQKVCAENHIHWTAPEYMIHNTKVIELYRKALDSMGLLSHERIEKFLLLSDVWTVENGLLTPTYKPRRKELSDRYNKEIEQLYE